MADANEEDGAAKGKPERRKIPGGMPYTTSAGVLKRVLEKLPASEKPSVFNTDFLSTVLQATGGSARPIPPILKAAGILNAGGVPTELYAQFQTEAGRSNAALQALRTGWSEIFRRNQFAHKADEKALLDIIVAITGLPRTDGIVRSILNTFQVFQEFAKHAKEGDNAVSEIADTPPPSLSKDNPVIANPSTGTSQVGLVYNINIVLPETTNVEVFNAIFKSLRGNLLS